MDDGDKLVLENSTKPRKLGEEAEWNREQSYFNFRKLKHKKKKITNMSMEMGLAMN